MPVHRGLDDFFVVSLSSQWTNSRFAGDLSRHDAYMGVIVMNIRSISFALQLCRPDDTHKICCVGLGRSLLNDVLKTAEPLQFSSSFQLPDIQATRSSTELRWNMLQKIRDT